MIENLIQNLIAISLGTMLFFSFVIAPVIFKVLDANNAGKFVRKIFPHYYLINLIVLSIAVLLLFYISSINLDFYMTLVITVLFAVSLFGPPSHTVDGKKNSPPPWFLVVFHQHLGF